MGWEVPAPQNNRAHYGLRFEVGHANLASTACGSKGGREREMRNKSESARACSLAHASVCVGLRMLEGGLPRDLVPRTILN